MSIALDKKRTAADTRRPTALHRRLQALKKQAGTALIAGLFLLGMVLAAGFDVSIPSVMQNFSYDIIIILVSMELFTNLVGETNIMPYLAVRVVALSRANKRFCLVLFGAIMFLISACMNNITAVLMLLPVIFVYLKSIDADRRYVAMLFSCILVMSNLGGAATPIGDFPAVIILSSNITTFMGYLSHAFLFFAATALLILAVFAKRLSADAKQNEANALAVVNLRSQYKNMVVRYDILVRLAVVFVCMLVCWCVVPQSVMPPELIAALGYVICAMLCAGRGVNIVQTIDLRSVIQIASFLFLAQVIAETGVLNVLVETLCATITEPKILILAIMLITSLLAGAFSAGPAAAVMMPVIVDLAAGPLAAQSDWIAVAYAAAICAGSSLFMWSASSGIMLSSKVRGAAIKDAQGAQIFWGVGEYLRYGLLCYALQISTALVLIVLAC